MKRLRTPKIHAEHKPIKARIRGKVKALWVLVITKSRKGRVA